MVLIVIIDKFIYIKWNYAQKSYYEEKGYIFTKNHELFLVNINDLPLQSNIKIKIMCDFCKQEIMVQRYHLNLSIDEEHACKKCTHFKVEKTMMRKYGTTNILAIPEFKEKRKQTCIKNFGVEEPFLNKEFRDKCKQNLLENFGVNNSMLIPSVQEKRKKTMEKRYGNRNPFECEFILKKIKTTNIERYGYENPAKCEKIKNKVKATNIEKFGCENCSGNAIIKNKQNTTLYQNGTAPCSKAQKYLHSLFGGELNFPINNIMADIAFPLEMLCIEYDGSGHDLGVRIGTVSKEHYQQSELKRNYLLRNNGWNLIRIISRKDYLYDDETFKNLLLICKNYFSTTEHKWIKIDVDNNLLISSQFQQEISYIKKISRKQLKVIMENQHETIN